MFRKVVRGYAIPLTLVAGLTLNAPLAQGYFAGGGKDAILGNDCLIGYDGITSDDVTLDGKKQIVQCTDCDPACDFDGVAGANGACVFVVGVCLNQSFVEGCTPPASLTLEAASVTIRVKAFGPIGYELPPLLEGDLCGALVDVGVPVIETSLGPKEGKAKIKLKALVTTPSSRKDKDALTYVCQPRPTGEGCPLP